MIFLTATDETLRLVITQALSTDITVGWVDHKDTGCFPSSSQTNVSAAGTYVIATAPAASEQRQIKFVSVKNRDGASTQVATIEKFDGTAYELVSSVSLEPDETLQYVDSIGFVILNNEGITKVAYAGTVKSVDASAPAAGLTISGAPITESGTLTFSLANDLAAVEGLGTNGITARIATDTWATRSLTAPVAGITISNADGVAGNPTFALANDLAAVEGLGSTGFASRTAANTWATRTLVGPAAGISITNADGVSGDPTLALTNDLAAIEAVGTTGVAVRTGTDTWATRTLTQPAAGISITNADGVAGNPTFALANDLAAVEGLSTAGLAARTGASTWTTRTLTGPAAGITVTNGDGVAGNPTLALSNDLAGIEAVITTGIAVRTATDTWATRTLAEGIGISLTNADGVAGDPTIALDTTHNRNVDHSAVVLTAGTGMTGGGDITASRTFNVVGANSIVANADDIQLVNDENLPGNSKRYGTSSTGVKGWYDPVIALEDDDNPVANSPHSILNFGDGLAVTDDGGGQATIDLVTSLDLATVSARRTGTNFTITTTPDVIPFNTLDIENDATTIEQISSTVYRVYETGVYLVSLNLTLGVSNNGRTLTGFIRKNGTTTIPSTQFSLVFNDAADTKAATPARFILLDANDTLEVIISTSPDTGTVYTNSSLCIGRYEGIVGPSGEDGADGAPGSGSTLIVKDEGTNVTNTPHSALNFIGPDVAVTDSGTGVANITVTGRIAQIQNKNITTIVSTTTVIALASTPTSTSGVPFDSHTITMINGANKVRVQCVLPCDVDNDAAGAVAVISRGSTVLAVASNGTKKESTQQIVFDFYDTPGAGTHIYTIRVGTTVNTSYFNRTTTVATAPFGGNWAKNCNITLTEIA